MRSRRDHADEEEDDAEDGEPERKREHVGAHAARLGGGHPVGDVAHAGPESAEGAEDERALDRASGATSASAEAGR